MRPSKYWDNFLERANETISCLKKGEPVPVRRVAIFITNKCQMKCQYCNHENTKSEMSESTFDSIIKTYGKSAIIHITGGEPSMVKWLYPYIRDNGDNYQIHLNTNALIAPPSEKVKRLKVSLDSYIAQYWNSLVGINAFDTVVKNIKEAATKTVVSITYTMTRENYRNIPEFIKFCGREFPGLYAIFFSVYKGNIKKFIFTEEDVNIFFSQIKPEMEKLLDEESKALLNETLTEKFRLMQGIRFPENAQDTCYLSLSERVYLPDGTMSGCSHLIRDKIIIEPGKKHEKCVYGCNRRLVSFNDLVHEKIIQKNY